MAFLITYCVVGGGITFGLYFLLHRRIEKKVEGISQTAFVLRAPLVFGWVNALLGAAFLVYYLAAPEAFSPDTEIVSQLGFVLMTIFGTYFYYLAMPISFGSIGISTLEKRKGKIAVQRFWLVLFLNSIGALTISYLSLRLFG